ncbi:MAG TPA: hypothetical protein VNT51_03040 [Miltoncostaeaceae bacterium]|nr:hypothetical protein [Miltoncostaeaceae bacterium]
MSQAVARRGAAGTAAAPALAVAAGWPVARRLGLGAVRPGGAAMTERLFEGVGLGEGDRVVDLAPGHGITGAEAGRRNLRAWTGVCADAAQAGAVRRRVRGFDRTCVVAGPDRTGLEPARATVVMAEGLLTGVSDPRKRAIVEEALRITRPGGRIGFHELCVLPGGWDQPGWAEIRAAIGPAVAGGVRVLDETGWRALMEANGLRVTGTSLGPLALPDLMSLVRTEGAKDAGRVLQRFMQPGRAAGRARAALYGLQTHADRLASIVIVAERPVVSRVHRRGAERVLRALTDTAG